MGGVASTSCKVSIPTLKGTIAVGGAVASASRKGVCKERIKLSKLALQRRDALAKAQKRYKDLQKTIAASITEFVVVHSSHASDFAKLPETACDHEEKKQQHDDEEDPREVGEEEGNAEMEDNAGQVEKQQEHDDEEEDSRAVVKEQKEADDENKEDNNKDVAAGIKANVEKRGLLDALKEVEIQFLSSANEEIAKDVCQFLEIDKVVQTQTAKGHKLIRSLTTRIRSTKLLSLVRTRSSKIDSLPSDDEKDKKHSTTLENLGAWEKQLYYLVEKVENEEKIGRVPEVKVAGQSVVNACNQIQQLRDQELQPQLVELLRGLTQTWLAMSDRHQSQQMIMYEVVKSLYSPPQTMFCDASHLHAADKLRTQLENWRAGFTEYVSSQKDYIKALDDWGRHPLPSFCEVKVPSLVANWLACFDKLSDDKTVIDVMDDLGRRVEKLVELQKKEHEHKSQVDTLKHKDWKIAEKIGQSSKTPDNLDYYRLRQRIRVEEEEYEASRKQTQEIAAKLVQTGFTSLFRSLATFSRTVAQSYGAVSR
ncbi:hypothetical protein M0R45_022776 [Rubus argutus]|uniref:DUF632 domain-containing protein n=1 Tax=Rubus argutus TaxID=59490 RepID=A0AAW1XIY2_RUBAR